MTYNLSQLEAICRLFSFIGQPLSPTNLRKGLESHKVDVVFTEDEIAEEISNNEKAIELQSFEEN